MTVKCLPRAAVARRATRSAESVLVTVSESVLGLVSVPVGVSVLG
jgi:hypothetical protein